MSNKTFIEIEEYAKKMYGDYFALESDAAFIDGAKKYYLIGVQHGMERAFDEAEKYFNCKIKRDTKNKSK